MNPSTRTFIKPFIHIDLAFALVTATACQVASAAQNRADLTITESSVIEALDKIGIQRSGP